MYQTLLCLPGPCRTDHTCMAKSQQHNRIFLGSAMGLAELTRRTLVPWTLRSAKLLVCSHALAWVTRVCVTCPAGLCHM
jgi:hypothetical protein